LGGPKKEKKKPQSTNRKMILGTRQK